MSNLSKVPFLANLDPADLKALVQRMERRSYEAGDLILADGTPGEGLYYVEHGTVTVLTSASCDGEIMAHLPPGSTFAETALLNDRPRSSAVRAATDCTIMVLPRSVFQVFLAEHPAAGQTIQQTLLQRPPRGARQLALELLKPMPLFKGVADDALITIARKLKLTQLCADSLVFSEGQAPDALYLIESGKVRLLSSVATGRLPLADLGQHDFFGEDAFLTDQPRELAAQVTSAADLWAFSRADFDSFITTYPAAALTMTRALAARSEELNRLLLATAVATPAARRVIAPVRVAPTMPARPTIVRQPLLPGLRSWVGSLSLGGRLRLAIITALLAWLALVSLPSAIASTLSGTAQSSALNNRATAAALTARGGASVRGLEILEASAITGAEMIDAAAAPLARMSDLVVEKKAAPAAAPPAAVVEAPVASPTVAAVEEPAQVIYKVQPGDTLGQIAAEFGLDVYVLAEANNIETRR